MNYKKLSIIMLALPFVLTACSSGGARHIASGLNGETGKVAGIAQPSASPSTEATPNSSESPKSTDQPKPAETSNQQNTSNDNSTHQPTQNESSQNSSVTVQQDQPAAPRTEEPRPTSATSAPSSTIKSGVTKEWNDDDEIENVKPGNVTSETPSATPSETPTETPTETPSPGVSTGSVN